MNAQHSQPVVPQTKPERLSALGKRFKELNQRAHEQGVNKLLEKIETSQMTIGQALIKSHLLFQAVDNAPTDTESCYLFTYHLHSTPLTISVSYRNPSWTSATLKILNDGTLSVDERSESFNPELTDEQLLDLVRKHLDQHVSKAANDEGEA